MRDFRDLACWRLSNELKCEVYAFTAAGAAARGFSYRDQVRDAGASAGRNIAEGFARFRPREFAAFLSVAKGSLAETRAGLIDGHQRGYLDTPTFTRLHNLARPAERTTTALLVIKRRQSGSAP